jgi:hypothetical protein
MSKPLKLSGQRTDAVAGGLAEAAATLGSMLGKFTKPKGKKKKSKTIAKSSSRATNRPMQLGSLARITYAPLPTAVGSTRSTSMRDDTTLQRFDISTVYVQTGTTGNILFNTIGDFSNGASAIDIHPIGWASNQLTMFGKPLSLMAQGHLRWRLRSLNVEYIPACGNSTTGEISIAVISEPFVGGAIVPGMVCACSGAFQGAAWLRSSIGVPAPVTDGQWKYCYENTTTAAEQRQLAPGNLVCAKIGTFGNSAHLGVIRMYGVMEFGGLASEADFAITTPNTKLFPLMSAKSAQDIASSSSVSSSSSVRPNPVYLDLALASVHECTRTCECEKEFVNVQSVAKPKLAA